MEDKARRQFTEFVTARTPSLMRLAYLLTGDQHTAEDLLQSALTKTAIRWRHIRDNPEAYVRTAMYNEQVGRWRSSRWKRERLRDTVPEVPTLDPSERVDLRLALHGALGALPPGQRVSIALRYLEDLPDQEIARLMKCSVNTVRSQIHRGLLKLREQVPGFAYVKPELKEMS